jgi:hypothetical protein
MKSNYRFTSNQPFRGSHKSQLGYLIVCLFSRSFSIYFRNLFILYLRKNAVKINHLEFKLIDFFLQQPGHSSTLGHRGPSERTGAYGLPTRTIAPPVISVEENSAIRQEVERFRGNKSAVDFIAAVLVLLKIPSLASADVTVGGILAGKIWHSNCACWKRPVV